MALAGWVYQRRENARKFSFSSGGNVAEKTLEVKALKFLQGWQVAGCRLLVDRFELQPPSTTSNPTVSSRIAASGVAAEVTRRKCLSRQNPPPHVVGYHSSTHPDRQLTTDSVPFTNRRCALIV